MHMTKCPNRNMPIAYSPARYIAMLYQIELYASRSVSHSLTYPLITQSLKSSLFSLSSPHYSIVMKNLSHFALFSRFNGPTIANVIVVHRKLSHPLLYVTLSHLLISTPCRRVDVGSSRLVHSVRISKCVYIYIYRNMRYIVKK